MTHVLREHNQVLLVSEKFIGAVNNIKQFENEQCSKCIYYSIARARYQLCRNLSRFQENSAHVHKDAILQTHVVHL